MKELCCNRRVEKPRVFYLLVFLDLVDCFVLLLPECTGRKAYDHELRKEVVCVNAQDIHTYCYLCLMIILLLTHVCV